MIRVLKKNFHLIDIKGRSLIINDEINFFNFKLNKKIVHR